MKPSSFQYHAARRVEEAIELFDRHGEDARVIAGGQSLGPMLNLRVARPLHVVDISRIAHLREIRVTADGLWIGGAVTHSRLEDETLSGVVGTLLRFVAGGIAYRSVRNRGTIGGSVVHADPAADWLPTLCALKAKVHLVSANGRRTVPMGDFVQGVFETALVTGEILEAIEIPALPANARWGFKKQVPSHGGFAAAIAACVMSDKMERALWLGACGTQPLDATAAIAAVDLNNTRSEQNISENISTLLEEIGGETDMERYRRHLHAVNAAYAIQQATTS